LARVYSVLIAEGEYSGAGIGGQEIYLWDDSWSGIVVVRDVIISGGGYAGGWGDACLVRDLSTGNNLWGWGIGGWDSATPWHWEGRQVFPAAQSVIMQSNTNGWLYRFTGYNLST
jgi:hypothetical protein